jgi:hypothetical protein
MIIKGCWLFGEDMAVLGRASPYALGSRFAPSQAIKIWPPAQRSSMPRNTMSLALQRTSWMANSHRVEVASGEGWRVLDIASGFVLPGRSEICLKRPVQMSMNWQNFKQRADGLLACEMVKHSWAVMDWYNTVVMPQDVPFLRAVKKIAAL